MSSICLVPYRAIRCPAPSLSSSIHLLSIHPTTSSILAFRYHVQKLHLYHPPPTNLPDNALQPSPLPDPPLPPPPHHHHHPHKRQPPLIPPPHPPPRPLHQHHPPGKHHPPPLRSRKLRPERLHLHQQRDALSHPQRHRDPTMCGRLLSAELVQVRSLFFLLCRENSAVGLFCVACCLRH